jgi:hypothetical protein
LVKANVGPDTVEARGVAVFVGVPVLVGAAVATGVGDMPGVAGVADGEGLAVSVAVGDAVAVGGGVGEGGESGVVSVRLSMHSTAGALLSTESAITADSGWKPTVVLTEKCV